MIRVTFANQTSRDAFADRFKIGDNKVSTDQLDIPWNLLQFAKLDDQALDYDEVTVLTAGPQGAAEKEFIVKGDPAAFGDHAIVLQNLGKGFYLVKSSNGTLLGDFVESIEPNDPAMTFMGNVSSMHDVNYTTASYSPTSSDAQWARLRVASRYRPLLKVFSTHEMVYQSKPELYIMDSGINFSHPEFQYDGLETENFFTLPAFNGLFDDDVGHGTLVAGMAVGKNLGIAAHCKLVNVKVGKEGHNPNLMELGEAIDAIVARASSNPTVTRIVNMSWTVAKSAWLEAKIQSLLDLGITVVCAAGNKGISVDDITPAGMSAVITVGSIDKYDIPSGFNNIAPGDSGLVTGSGLQLDIFAPGEDVIVAGNDGTYWLTSGTSFAAPLVAGIATTIASLHSTIVPYADLKNFVLSTATKDALLFEDDRFSENQNNLAYLFTSDPNSIYKADNIVTYLGVHDEQGNPIIANLNSAVSVEFMGMFADDTITWSIRFLDPQIEAVYSPFMSVDPVTGILTIAKPVTTLPEETKLKMVEFVATASSPRLKAESTTIFFFDTNPLYKDTLQSDITLALTETNSISFYAGWGMRIK